VSSKKYLIFAFGLGFIGYLLLLFQWYNKWRQVWYANLPEETQMFKINLKNNTYPLYLYFFVGSFLLFILTGIVNGLLKKSVKWHIFLQLFILIFSCYLVWIFNIFISRILIWDKTFYLGFLNLGLFVLSIFFYLLFLQKHQSGLNKKEK
jgi:hypothetical protein